MVFKDIQRYKWKEEGATEKEECVCTLRVSVPTLLANLVFGRARVVECITFAEAVEDYKDGSCLL